MDYWSTLQDNRNQAAKTAWKLPSGSERLQNPEHSVSSHILEKNVLIEDAVHNKPFKREEGQKKKAQFKLRHEADAVKMGTSISFDVQGEQMIEGKKIWVSDVFFRSLKRFWFLTDKTMSLFLTEHDVFLVF